jgi:hypothetical protein
MNILKTIKNWWNGPELTVAPELVDKIISDDMFLNTVKFWNRNTTGVMHEYTNQLLKAREGWDKLNAPGVSQDGGK